MRRGRVLCGAAAGLGLAAAATAGMTCRFTTASSGGRYGPSHALAAWIADAGGRPVRILAVASRRQARHLARWREATGGKAPDAVTGATRRAHGPMTVTWDGLDDAGAPAPDGVYALRIEFTERNGEGPGTPEDALRFTKGPRRVALHPADLPHFRDITLEYVPGP